MNEHAHAILVTRTLRLKVRREAYAWLNAAAIEVNLVWNWANETSAKAAHPFAGQPRWLTGFDLNNLSMGATEYFTHIGADTIQRVNGEYGLKRRQFKRLRLRCVSRGSRRSLGWVPFKAASLKRKGRAVRFCGKTFRREHRRHYNGFDDTGDYPPCRGVLPTAGGGVTRYPPMISAGTH